MMSRRLVKSSRLVFIAAWVSIVGIVGAAEKAVFSSDRHVTADGISFYKYVDSDGVTHTSVRDKNGKEILWNEQMQPKSDVVSNRLAAVLNDRAADNMLVVKIALRDPAEDDARSMREHGAVEVENGAVKRMTVNGERKNLLDAKDTYFAERQKVLDARHKARRQKVRAHTMEVVAKHALNIPLSEVEKYADNGESMTLTMKKSDLKKFIESNKGLIAAVDLPDEPKDQITTAMVATGVNQMHSLQTNPGAGIGIYMTESGCRDPAGFANYMRLAGSNTDHSRNVSGILRAVSPNAFIYCRGGPALPQTSELGGVEGNPRIRVINRSNGDGSSTEYGITDRDWDNFQYTHRVLHFAAAGNTTNGPFTITPGKGLNSVTVGNYNHQNNTIAATSISVNPSTKNVKPELSAPGTNINAGGFIMTGTSMAAPHAAAISANFMSAIAFVRDRTQLARAQMMAAALAPVIGGFDRVGVGGARYPQGMGNYNAYWWEGANNCFDAFAVNGVITATFNITAAPIPRQNVSVVAAWETRGTWTYDNRNAANPIGVDFDISVYAPNGALVGASSSWNNPFEWVRFTATQAGTYRVEIRRYANRDTAAQLRLGLWVYRGD